MKLLYLVNVRLPGDWAHSIQIVKTCEAFASQGLEVELVTGLKRGSDEEIFAHYNIKTKFKITKIPQLNLSSTSPSKINFLIRSFSFLLSAKLYTLFKQSDILYFRAPLAGLFFKNYYLELHDLPLKPRSWHKIAYRKAKKIIVLTKYLKTDLLVWGVNEAKIIIAGDAVDLREFKSVNLSKIEARQKLFLPADKKIIAYTGNFSFHDWKGVDILLQALELLPGVICLLIGGEDEEQAQINKKYRSANIIITGRKAHKDIPLYLRAADVLVLPNKKANRNSAYYTSPLKLFEYMASQRPIIASNLPSLKEILSESNSVLVEPDNPQALANGIKLVLDDSQKAEKLAKQAQIDVNSYTWEKRAQKILKS